MNITKPLSAGVITALASEMRIMPGRQQAWKLGSMPVRIHKNALARTVAFVRSGIGLDNSFDAATMLLEAGVLRLSSTGIAGGIDPSLGSGDVVVATTVLSPRKSGSVYIMRCDDKLSDAITQRLEMNGVVVRRGPVFSSPEPVCMIREKQRLFRETGATVVEMEASGVARAAMGSGAPLVVLKVVSDEAGISIPCELTRALRDDGTINMLNVVTSILKRPRLARQIITLEKGFSAAISSLEKCWKICVDLM